MSHKPIAQLYGRFDEHLILYTTHQHPVPFLSLPGNEVVQGFFFPPLIVITEIPLLLLFPN